MIQTFLGDHVSWDEGNRFLSRDLSETKTALIERHLLWCDECAKLLLLLLQRESQFTVRWHRTIEIYGVFDSVQ
jgi:hypothetical protein